MLKTSAMASSKNTDPKRKKDGVINNLKDLFGNVLHIDIIRSVASQCDFDVQKSSNVLLEMTNNIEEPPKKKEKPKPKNTSPRQPQPKSRKTLELERVVNHIRQGYKVLVILRGLPGSGKSRLAVAITDHTLGPGNNSHHILSTDDYFIQQRGYCFDPNRLQEAHEWNHRRAFQAMSRGLSPVIIDNTNTQMWEMKPYAMMATDYGYIIEILEPDTWWAFNDKELAKRNIHNVPRAKIKDMIDRYEKNVNTQKLLYAYNLVYKFQKPPQLRLVPPIINNTYNDFRSTFQQQNGFNDVTKSKSTSALDENEVINLMDFNEIPEESTDRNENQNWDVNPVDQILMCTEENQVEVLQPTSTCSKSEPNLFPDMENAWGINEKALQSWDIVTPITDFTSNSRRTEVTNNQEVINQPETRDNSSSIETTDYLINESQLPFGCRIIQAKSRDINVGSPIRNFSPPKKTMIDQSCLTDEMEDNEDEQRRIKDLMDLFPRVPKSSLIEFYNRCNKNFHWTVDLLLEDNNLEVAEGLELAEEVLEVVDVSSDEEQQENDKPKETKVSKRKTTTEDSLELKRVIESKFDINKEHYSEHVYRVKQIKFGSQTTEPQPSTSSAVINCDSDIESDDDSCESDDDPKNMIELNLGETFVNQLETMFGGDEGTFPKGFQPVVQMPTNLARQIYSFYIESICQQMEAQNNILHRLVKEDEEFARKVQSQEEAHFNASRPPNFMEIMDEQVALNLHRRDVDEWKNMTAENLAMKLTKQKLFNTFPKLDKDALLEIWHANDYNYNKTVEDLMMSVGPENVNGSGEAIKEPPLSESTLKEMKEAEEDCGEVEESEEQKPATYYREVANQHLQKRAQLYEKAKSYYQRGLTDVAMFYSELAKKETKSYDRANHIAAAAFVDEHSKRLQKFDTLDLHYFYVKEAIPNLDIFIDRNINLLKGGIKRGQDLFVITGRGKNSEGGRCKIKPAVITRLKKRKIGFVQLNPGLLKIRVMRDSPMTSDLP